MFRHAYTLLLLASFFWAGNAIGGKLALGHVSPMVLNSARWAIAIIIIAAIGRSEFRKDWPVLKSRLLYIFLLGTVGFTLFNVVLYNAVRYTTVINVSIEQAAMPMFIFALNFLLFRTGVGVGQIIGFLLSVVGVALTASHGDLSTLAQLQMNFGDALMMIAVIAYSGYTVALRNKPDVHWKSLMLAMCISAFVSSIPFTMWEIAAGNAIMPTLRGYAIIAYTSLFPSIVSQIFYIRGVELIGGNRAGLFVNMIPIFGTLMSVVLLGEAFQLYHAASLLLVFGGIWLAEHSGRRRALQAG
ncbi:DMT family transporter [Aquamicrobium zhengzhouense]|uniref:DMT family transporter n=1 Tax=Aquamicrobium zhengzhouense TaxID=2781738 RepID=A0ABS0SG93_9HYPH|nr:DMT family transporter [Aquamicrobium zhengzhouense]MBI1622325.1 DMT family transporter [Aquamicrobium zhengzhouense]